MEYESLVVGDFIQEIVMKPCPSFPGYSISDTGRVFTHRKRFGLGRGCGGGVWILRQHTRELRHHVGHGGYSYISVSVAGMQRTIPVHVLMADAFIGPRPDGMEVRHLDGNPKNSVPANLCYGTVAENAQDRIKHGRQPRGENHGRAILKEPDIRSIRYLHAQGDSIAGIARQWTVGESTIRDVVKGRKWNHVR